MHIQIQESLVELESLFSSKLPSDVRATGLPLMRHWRVLNQLQQFGVEVSNTKGLFIYFYFYENE